MKKRFSGTKSSMNTGAFKRVFGVLVVFLVASVVMVGAGSAADGTTPSGTLDGTRINNGETPGWVTICGDAVICGTESMVVKMYSGEKLLGTTTLIDPKKEILTGSSDSVTWNFFLKGSDSYWQTKWEAGDAPLANDEPDTVKLYVDGVLVDDDSVELTTTAVEVSFLWGDLEGVMIAKIGDVYYDTLQGAINAAESGQTVTLLGDTDTGSKSLITVAADDDIIIDLNKNTVTGSFMVKGKATIKNGTITNTYVLSGIESNGADANLTVEDLTIITNRHALRIDGGKATIISGTYTTTASKESNGGEPISGYAVSVGSDTLTTTVTIHDGIFNPSSGSDVHGTSVTFKNERCVAVIMGGTFNSFSTNSVESYGKMTISGGTFANSLVLKEASTDISGGTFTYDGNKYTDKEHVAIKNAEGKWDVFPGYEITLNSNFDESTTSPLYVKAGDSTSLSSEFTRDTYDLAAWNTKDDGSGATYANKAEITFSADTTLYAQWVPTSYAITPADTEGKGTITVPEKAQHSSDVTVLVEPAAGYELDAITVSLPEGATGEAPTVTKSGNAGTFKMPTSTVTVSATFKAKEYAVSIGEIKNGSVTVDSTAQYGVTVSVTTNPNTGYILDKITVKNVTDGTEFTVTGNSFTMPADNVIVTAAFKAQSYAVTSVTGTNGKITGLPSTAEYGTKVSFTVTPTEGYQLEKITVVPTNGGGESFTVGSPEFIMPAYAVTVSATFSQNLFTITTTAPENGQLTVSAASAAENSEITVTATPNTGYKLADEDGITVKEANSETSVAVTDGKFSMPAKNVIVTAAFEKLSYTITNETSQNGAITVTTSASYGDEITVTATPEEGYEFESLSITPEGRAAYTVTSKTFTMPASAVTVSATFKAAVQPLTLNEAEGGVITASPVSPKTGDTVTISATINDGYEFKSFTVVDKDGAAVDNTSTGTTATFTMPAGGVTVTLVTEKTPFDITVVTPENGELAVLMDGTSVTQANVSDVITITATPEHGYKLDTISVITALGEPVTVTDGTFEMPASAVTISVTFVEGTPDVPDNDETPAKPSSGGSSGTSTWATETPTQPPTDTPTTTPTDTQAPTDITPTTPGDSTTEPTVPVAALIAGGLAVVVIGVGAVLVLRRRP